MPAFRIDGTPVTNAQFLAFVEDGGYRRPELWADEDRVWLGHAAIEHPVVWELEDGRWLYRTLFERVSLESVGDWPVYVSLAEARAFARLARRAPRHRGRVAARGVRRSRRDRAPLAVGGHAAHRAARQLRLPPLGSDPGGHAPGRRERVGRAGPDRRRVGVDQHRLRGLPGFSTYIPGYAGYSADFFDGKHYVLKGGSWATADDLIRPSFRNWFQAHYPYVFAKFRCVVDG